jgi:hypothetical protein
MTEKTIGGFLRWNGLLKSYIEVNNDDDGDVMTFGCHPHLVRFNSLGPLTTI